MQSTCNHVYVQAEGSVVARDRSTYCISARLPSVEQDRGELVEERSEGLLEQRHAALAGRMLVRVRARARVRVWVWVRARARARGIGARRAGLEAVRRRSPAPAPTRRPSA